MGRERTEGERRASDELAEGIRRETERFFDAVIEEINRNPGAYRLGTEPLPEDEADAVAYEAVHRARGEIGREVEEPAPNPGDAQRWHQMRERDREEGRERYWLR